MSTLQDESESTIVRLAGILASLITEREFCLLRIDELNEKLRCNREFIKEYSGRLAEKTSEILYCTHASGSYSVSPSHKFYLNDELFSLKTKLNYHKQEESDLLDWRTQTIIRLECLPKPSYWDSWFAPCGTNDFDQYRQLLPDPAFVDSRENIVRVIRPAVVESIAKSLQDVFRNRMIQPKIPVMVSESGMGDMRFARFLVALVAKCCPDTLDPLFLGELAKVGTIFINIEDSQLLHPGVIERRLIDSILDFIEGRWSTGVPAHFRTSCLSSFLGYITSKLPVIYVFDGILKGFNYKNLADEDREEAFEYFVFKIAVRLLQVPRLYITFTGCRGSDYVSREEGKLFTTFANDVVEIMKKTGRYFATTGPKLAEFITTEEGGGWELESYTKKLVDVTRGKPKLISNILSSAKMVIPESLHD